MNPMETDPFETVKRHQEEQRRRMLEARAMVYTVHSRTGLLTRLLRDLANGVDPTGRQRKNIR